jgi:hypothetical protein
VPGGFSSVIAAPDYMGVAGGASEDLYASGFGKSQAPSTSVSCFASMF